ncbi:hypothetical protein IFM89_011518 [Coptis chinensis]|uniref:Deubiquitinating enzyme MINDY-3/4 conserved domain-containing protein n=1 Tax=Coptis chinensis TaxID=261450 RepID=A0A835M9P4_9MAGN|nr:hypothetical protein IFM89_011518 [Coptis chinensis]
MLLASAYLYQSWSVAQLEAMKQVCNSLKLELESACRTKEIVLIFLSIPKNEYVLIDGLGDVLLPRFGYRTPLQVAKTPNLDPVEAGLACGSDTAHLSLLGWAAAKMPKMARVVGSESHYTVLFAFDTSVQNENELEERESHIRRAFDAQDQSGGVGFISVEGLHEVLLDLDKSLGGWKNSTGLMGRKVFDLYHFNGIAKSVLNGSQATARSDSPIQRPRLLKLRVSIPPRWTPDEFITGVPSSSGGEGSAGKDTVVEVMQPKPPQHTPVVDRLRITGLVILLV